MKINAQQNKAFAAYYEALEDYKKRGVTDEEGLRPAFFRVLETYSPTGWKWVLERRVPNRRKPDGTLFDEFNLPRGYWEAKDPKDDLEAEIRKKIKDGYPLTNIIFEDTQHAVLYQQGKRIMEGDLHQPRWLADLLQEFLTYTEPAIESFGQAVTEFKDRIPDLAQGLLSRIREEYSGNKTFVRAFEEFHTLCKEALNPQLSREAIEEMLVQHLLTERLFRTVFNNPDFTSRNIIAREIEKVIQALTSRAFNRAEFLSKLDRFYKAIERAAEDITDWKQKQTFLNTVYERFFQGFAIKQADVYGIVYTPQEIVDFMVASVEEVLQREFGSSLSTPGVKILDPCTGTGSFIVNILRRIAPSALKRKYTEDLFANEIMLLPYYIASLNIEHAYYERTGEYLPFDGICFVDTLDMAAEGHQQNLWLSEANTERIQNENMAEITVIIGNPPYNSHQQNENDNNKNRRYEVIDGRIRETYARDSQASLRTHLSDAYVRFFRWATDRLGNRDGIICMVSNNSFVDQLVFDGMRKHLLKDFTQIYHLDLHGNVRKNPKLSGTTHNVFGIQVGVGITIAVRTSHNPQHFIRYYRVPEMWRKMEKLTYLEEEKNCEGIAWQELQPDEKHTWLTEGLRFEFDSFLPIGTKEARATPETINAKTIFKTYSIGIKTGRDNEVYDFDRSVLAARIEQVLEHYNAEVSRWVRAGRPVDADSFVHYDKIKWSRNLKRDLRSERYAQFDTNSIRRSLYRPFSSKWLYFDDMMVDERGGINRFFPTSASEAENVLIAVSDHGYRSPFSAMVTNLIPCVTLLATTDTFQCFPFYTYAEDGSGRQENITNWALEQFRAQYGDEVSKRNIFHYVYALLHHPQYRECYAENLKRELPRIPIVPDREAFVAFAQAGARLAELHLNYEYAEQYPLRHVESEPFSWRVEKMRLSQDKSALVYNDSLTLNGIPAKCFNYRLGNRSALEWVIDQYQVSTDSRSGIKTDPNREDDEEYIVRLVKQVVTVSLETVALVESLPPLPDFAQGQQEEE